MKTLVKSDSMYSLQNVDNFYPILETNINTLMNKYSVVVINYFHYIHNKISSKNDILNKFIITRGLDTITHVFIYLLHYTKNSEIALYYCEKASYFYVEFVTQISTDETSILQLSSRDAANYVYKKTIFEIKYDKQHPESNTEETSTKMKLIELHINLYKLFFYKMIHSDSVYNMYIVEVINLIRIINSVILNIECFSILKNIIDIFCYKIKCPRKFLEIIKCIVNKTISNTNVLFTIHKNTQRDEHDALLADKTTEKFIKWLIKP